jgi:hypothetical protein
VNHLVPFPSPSLPSLVAAAGDRARVRFLEFFAANIRNPHTRRAYARAVAGFLAWCESVASLRCPIFSRCMWRAGSSSKAARSRPQRQAAARRPAAPV